MYIGDFAPVFGKNLRYLRRLCGMSQRTLAVLVGMEPRLIRKIEHATGTIGMDIRIYCRMREVFDLEEIDFTRQDLEEQGFSFPTYKLKHWPPVREYHDNTSKADTNQYITEW